jgi:bifunctional non-homologous end joining protein LigD
MVLFDLLYLDGKSLLSEPLEKRKELLQALVVPTDKLQVSPQVPGDGTALFEVAKARRLEGVVAKKLGTPYRPGRRGREWLKIKATYDADLVVGGWSKGEGSRSGAFGSILVGAYEGDELRYLGSVGTGFTDKLLGEVLKEMKKLETDDNPFNSDPRKDKLRWGKPIKDPHWIRPDLVARVEFRELTAAGRLRAPSFKGLRRDKDPEECLYDDLVAEAAPEV